LQVLPPPAQLMMSTGHVSISCNQGSNPSTVELPLWNEGGTSLNWYAKSYADWITVSPATNRCAPGQTNLLTLTFDTERMNAGTYSGIVPLFENGNGYSSLTNIFVSLTIHEQNAAIDVYPSTISQGVTAGSGMHTQRIYVINRGTTNMSYTLNTVAPWLTISPTTGTVQAHAYAAHNLVFDSDALAETNHTGSFTVDSAAAANSPFTQTVSVAVAADVSLSPSYAVRSFVTGTVAVADVSLELQNRGSTNPVEVTLSASANWFAPQMVQTQLNGASVMTVPVSFAISNLPSSVVQGRMTMQPQPEGSQPEVCSMFMLPDDAYGSFEEKVVFQEYTNGHVIISSVNPDGSDRRVLLAKNGCDLTQPRISPDGRKLACLQSSNGVHNMIVHDVLTAAETICTPLDQFYWKSDSLSLLGIWSNMPQILYYTNNAMSRIYIDGGKLDIWDVDPVRNAALYTRSPGFAANTRIASTLLAGTPIRATIQEQDGREERQGTFSKNGSLIAYSKADAGMRSPYRLYVNAATGGAERLVSTNTATESRAPDFAPDDQSLIFVKEDSGESSLFALNLSNGVETAVYTMSGSAPDHPQWTWLYVPIVENPLLELSSDQWQTNAVTQSEIPVEGSMQIRNAGSGQLNFAISNVSQWVSVENGDASSTGEWQTVTLRVSARSLDPGIYTNTLSVTANTTNAPLPLQIVFTVDHLTPNFALAPTSMAFQMVQHGNKTGQYASVWNDAPGAAMPFTVTEDAAWLTVFPSSGSSTGEAVNCYLECDPTGLATGMYQETAAFVYAAQTQNLQVTMQVIPVPPPDPPLLSVSPAALSNQVTRTERAPSQLFYVQNTGDGALVYQVAETSNWIRVYPNIYSPRFGMSTGERDTLRVEYDTRFLAEGTYTEDLLITSTVATQSIPVIMRVLPRPRVTLTTVADPTGSGLFIADPSPDKAGTHEQGSYVRLRAVPGSDYTFINWGTNKQDNSPSIDVYMQSNITRTAHFLHQTRLRGTVYNEITHAPINDAQVVYADNGGMTTFSDVNGVWEMNGTITTRENPWIAVRDGYRLAGGRITPAAHTNNQVDIAMEPRFVRNVRGEQMPGTELVTITYDLSGNESDNLNVTLQLSANNGASWTIFPQATLGCTGQIRSPRRNMMILWNAGVEWDQYITTQMIARVNAGGGYCLSRPFRVDTLQVSNWTVTVTAQKEGFHAANLQPVPVAEVYYGGRTTNHLVGTTDRNGQIRMTALARAGQTLFARKMVYTHPARFPAHEQVGNAFFNLWLDSDLGPDPDESADWDGSWRTYTLTDLDMSRISRGLSQSLPIKHPLFEWNLTVAAESVDENFLNRLRVGFGSASYYMNDVYDGQMKFGRIAITSGVARGSQVWSNCDMRVFNVDGQQALTVNAPNKYTAPYVRHQPWNFSRWIEMGSTWWSALPNQYDYYASIVHECGHYHNGFADEYLTGGVRNWRDWRAANINDFTENYGLMDNEHSISELSSWNDYPVYNPPVQSNRTTRQAWAYDLDSDSGSGPLYPCWEWTQFNYDTAWSGYVVRLVLPPPGNYVNGFSTSADRAGPHVIPYPYAVASVAVDGVWTNWYQERNRSIRATGRDFPVIRVLYGNEPAVGAQVSQNNPATGRFGLIGRTDARGELPLIDAIEGSAFTATWQGHSVSETLSADTLNNSELLLRLRRTREVYPLSSNRLAVVIGGSLDTNGIFALNVRSSLPLSAAPAAAIWPNNTSSNAVLFSQESVDSPVYTASVDIASARGGTFTLALAATNGLTLETIDGYHCGEKDGVAFIDSFIGHVEIYFSDPGSRDQCPAVCYQYNGPSILTDGMTRTNQAGPQVFFTRANADTYFTQHSAAMNWNYRDQDVIGADERTLRLFRWEPTGAQWHQETNVTYDTARNVVSALITNNGAFALFAAGRTDTVPPAAVTNLLANSGSITGYVHLSWTATGDNGNTGTAAVYYVQSGTNETEALDWSTSYQVLSQTPQAAGSEETAILRMDVPGQSYVFTIRAADAAGNISETSNVSSATALLDDANGDGISDAWMASVNLGRASPMGADDDVDNDGLTTWEEFQAGTDANAWDTDGDAMSDQYELDNHLNPLSPEDADVDTDQDALTNLEEAQLATLADNPDTDADSMPDGWEHEKGLDPLTDANEDGGQADPDNDSSLNEQEYIADSDPLDTDSVFRMEDVEIDDQGIRMIFQSSARRVYQFSETTDLENWQNMGGPFYGSNDLMTVIITNTDRSVQFYRIEVSVP